MGERGVHASALNGLRALAKSGMEKGVMETDAPARTNEERARGGMGTLTSMCKRSLCWVMRCSQQTHRMARWDTRDMAHANGVGLTCGSGTRVFAERTSR